MRLLQAGERGLIASNQQRHGGLKNQYQPSRRQCSSCASFLVPYEYSSPLVQESFGMVFHDTLWSLLCQKEASLALLTWLLWFEAFAPPKGQGIICGIIGHSGPLNPRNGFL